MRAHRGGHPPGHVAALGQAYLADHVGHAGAAREPVVRALLVRQPGPGQRLGQRPGLRVGAVQHGDVGQAELAVLVPVGPAAVEAVERRPAEQLVDGGGDPGRLGVLVRRLVQGDDVDRDQGSGIGPGRESGPSRDQRGGRDGLHGGGHDGRVGAVVPGQLHRAGPGEVGGEPAEDADVGAAETVDGLVRVADRGQPGAVAADQPEQLVLDRVDVLVLVHADPRPAGAQPGRGVRVVAEHGGGQLDQAVEVDQVPVRQRAPQLRTAQQLAPVPLGTGHLGRDLERGRLVGHLEPRGEPGRLGVLAQDPQAQAVERGHRGLALPEHRAASRSCISWAARRVNVMARKDPAGWPRSAIWWAIR